MHTIDAALPRLAPTTTADSAAPPTAAGAPLLGPLPALLRDAPGALLREARRHGAAPFLLNLGPARVVVVTDPAHVQDVLVDRARDYTKGGMWTAVRDLLGNGLVTSEGSFWLRQRRLLQPLFGARHLGALADRMIDAVLPEVDRLAAAAAAGATVEMGAEMTLITQRVLVETLFGASIDRPQAVALGEHLRVAFEHMGTRLFLYFLPQWFPLPGARAYRRAITAMDQALLAMVAARRAAGPDAHDDILSRLLSATDADTGERMSDRQIRDELITLFVAGQDTTAVSLTWLFWLLDRHPDVLARLRAEHAQVLGDRRPSAADLQRLVYTRQVLQEAMRLYPPAWVIPRFCPDETPLGKFTIPADTAVLLSPYLTQRDPALWDRPDEFDPERFAPGAEPRHRYAYFPFGGGGRQCIGNHFAMMEAQLILALLLRRVQPRSLPGPAPRPSSAGTLKPKGGLRMRLTPA